MAEACRVIGAEKSRVEGGWRRKGQTTTDYDTTPFHLSGSMKCDFCYVMDVINIAKFGQQRDLDILQIRDISFFIHSPVLLEVGRWIHDVVIADIAATATSKPPYCSIIVVLTPSISVPTSSTCGY